MIGKRLKLSKYAFIIESGFGYIIYSSATVRYKRYRKSNMRIERELC